MTAPLAESRLVEAPTLAPETADGPRSIRGVALRYGSLSLPMVDHKGREFRERFAPGAFSKALGSADVRALVNHDRNLILGRTKSGTLRLLDEDDALRFELDPPKSGLAQHYLEAVERGDITGVSFRFYALKDRWTPEGNAYLREVNEADIDDISIVTYPAYPDTEAATRSLESYCRSQPRRTTRLDRARRRLRLAEADLS
jgi:HK97 family phage prohead protease